MYLKKRKLRSLEKTFFSKKGISNILSTILLLVLAIVIVVVVWSVVNSTISRTGESSGSLLKDIFNSLSGKKHFSVIEEKNAPFASEVSLVVDGDINCQDNQEVTLQYFEVDDLSDNDIIDTVVWGLPTSLSFSGGQATGRWISDCVPEGETDEDDENPEIMFRAICGTSTIDSDIFEVTGCGTVIPTEVDCTDGIDNDNDGLTDCADTDCSGEPSCTAPPLIYLTQCGTPEGGWQSGKTYVISNDIVMQSSDSACFIIDKDNIIIDGSGKKLGGEGRPKVTTGIIIQSNGVTVKNLTISNFQTGMLIREYSSQNLIENCVFDFNYENGIALIAVSNSNNIKNNIIRCNDNYCMGSSVGITIVEGAISNNIEGNTIEGYARNIYVAEGAQANNFKQNDMRFGGAYCDPAFEDDDPFSPYQQYDSGGNKCLRNEKCTWLVCELPYWNYFITTSTKNTWYTQSIMGAQTGTFAIVFDVTPTSTTNDLVVGLSNGVADAYTDLAAIVRFNTAGKIDVRNGGVYDISTLSYQAGTTYRIKMVIDIPSHIYSVYVTSEGGNEIALATNYAFRTEQSSVSVLDYWSVIEGTDNVGSTVWY